MVIFEGSVTSVKLLQNENACSPKLETLLGITTRVILSLFAKADFPIDSKLLENVGFDIFLQRRNASNPIFFTLLGIGDRSRFSQSRKARSPISSRFVVDDTSTFVRFLQPSNASLPILVILAGIVTVDNLLHPCNRPSGIYVQLLGIITLSRPSQA